MLHCMDQNTELGVLHFTSKNLYFQMDSTIFDFGVEGGGYLDDDDIVLILKEL